MEKKIPEFWRTGKAGEYHVASLLSSFANMMTPHYDVGIDFYCELLESNSSSGLIFLIQVKSTKKFKSSWSKNIEKETINFWISQPFPVFIILFEETSQKCFWMSVEDHRNEWMAQLRSKTKSISIKINRLYELKREGTKKAIFVNKIKSDVVLVNANQGKPSMIGKGYVRQIPILRLSDTSRHNILHNIRIGFDYLINDSLLKKNLKNAYKFGKLLTNLDKAHYDHFLVLARVSRQLKLTKEAKINYQQAIEICKADYNWNQRKQPNDPKIEDIIESIEREKASL